MANLPGRKRGRVLTRLAVAATAAALVGTTAGSAVADTPVPAPLKSMDMDAATEAASQAADAPINTLHGVDKAGGIYGYQPNGTGGLDVRQNVGSGWNIIKQATQVDHDADGRADGIWEINNSGYLFYAPFNEAPISVGSGWNIYNKVLSPGNLAGVAADDLLARDTSGVLWIYAGYGNGKLTGRTKVGSGWNTYNQIAGQGDLSGDGKADVVARDGSGVLWLYKGTGNRTTPFTARTKIGSGWNIFNSLVSVGDIDIDGKTDLIARDGAGALWLYKGTGSAAAPYKARVKIGAGGWNTYRLLF